MNSSSRYLIRNLMLYDGTGAFPSPADLYLDSGKILKILPPGTGSSSNFYSFDAHGCAAAPGFIDIHSHSDASILAAPEAFGKISQGVTLDLVGNCGLSVFPAPPEVQTHLNELYRIYGVRVDWTDLQG